jgi:hypothetical protein
MDTLNSIPIYGKATCTIIKSTITMNCAKTKSVNTSPRFDETALVGVLVFGLFDFLSLGTG